MKKLAVAIFVLSVLGSADVVAKDAASGNWGSGNGGVTGQTNNQSTFYNQSGRSTVVQRGGSVNSVAGSTGTVRGGGFNKNSSNDRGGF